MENEKICPRCGKKYSGYPALSRYIDEAICSNCGTDEALRDWFRSPPLPFEEWAIPPKNDK